MVSASFVIADAGPEALSDADIVERVRAGETAFYEILMRRYNQRLYRIARTILRNDAEAEDVMQDAYVRAYEHLDEFAGEAKFSTWLTKIAIYEALARVRRRSRMTAIEHDEWIDAADPERAAADAQLRGLMEHAIDNLPETYRTVFVFRLVEGLSVSDTAAALGVGEETVKTRLHRARALVRKELERRAGIVAAEVFPFHLSRCDRVVQNVLRRIAGDNVSGKPTPETGS